MTMLMSCDVCICVSGLVGGFEPGRQAWWGNILTQKSGAIYTDGISHALYIYNISTPKDLFKLASVNTFHFSIFTLFTSSLRELVYP